MQTDLFGGAVTRPGRTSAPRNRVSGRFLKEEGQSRALENAGAEWRVTIVALLADWLKPRRGQRFVFEDFRAQVPIAAHPKSHKAWGALASIAVRQGLVRSTGQYVAARSPRTHNHPVRLWEAL